MPGPGNVRELRNVVERAVYRAEDPEREIDAIQFDPFASPWVLSPDPAGAVEVAAHAAHPAAMLRPSPPRAGAAGHHRRSARRGQRL